MGIMLRWALIAVGVLTVLGLLLLQFKQKRAQTLTEAEGKQREELAARAGQAASELAHGGELEDVVLRCYRDMVAILTRQAEVSMTPEMTAREFAARLRALSLAEEPVDVLTALFERVRYGEETLGEAERKKAVKALRAIEQRFGPPETEFESKTKEAIPTS